MPTQAGFQTDLTVAAYTSDPLSANGNSRNRFSNAVFYNSPVFSGFQFNATVATAVTLVGLIYLLVLSFVQTMVNDAARAVIGPYLRTKNYIVLRLVDGRGRRGEEG